MKKIFYLMLLFTIASIIRSQSLMVFDAGTDIDVGTGADICANIVTINGTYSGSGTLCNGALPVELSSLTAAVEEKTVSLRWRTETEVNNYGFEVERAVINSKSTKQKPRFEKIGFVKGHGNSNSPKDYSFIDEKPFGGSNFQYRLKQIDTDGQIEYSDIVEVEVLPDKFELLQNYPNPLNPSTRINYSMPEISFVTLRLYDVLGNEILTLVNEEKPAGNYSVEFNAANLPSGSYFYRLTTNKFSETKKMILMK